MKYKISEHIDEIITNILSNAVWYGIGFIVTILGLLIPLVRDIIRSIKSNTIDIALLSIVLFIISLSILLTATIIIIALTRHTISKNNANKDSTDYESFDYYFNSYEKHLTIYNDGTGIIINSFEVTVNNIDSFKRIRRRLNIEDGKKTSNFPTLQKMLDTSKKERFDKFGFWYYSKENIISQVKEYYWNTTHVSSEDKKAKGNPKELRWIFEINRSKLEAGKTYHIIYAISVPGIASLDNGLFNKKLVNDDIFSEESCSNMHIDHKIKKLTYIVSFESGINLLVEPTCEFYKNDQDETEAITINGVESYNMFYNKYTFNVNNPLLGSDIKVTWKFKDMEDDCMEREGGD